MCFVFGGVEAFSPFLLQCFLFIAEAMKGQNLSLSLSLMIFFIFFNWGNGLPSPHVGHITTRWAPSRSLVHGVPLYKAENKWGKLWLKPTPKYVELLGPYLSLVGAQASKKNTSIQRSTPTPSSPLGPLFAGELFDVQTLGF